MNYRETITQRADFDYLHKKQSGGQGQYGRVVGYIEPLPEGTSEKFEYANEIVGNAIPPSFLPSCKKGFEEAVNCGEGPHLPSLLAKVLSAGISVAATVQLFARQWLSSTSLLVLVSNMGCKRCAAAC